MFNAMCDDLNNAKLNRERVKQGYGNDFYDKQANIVAQWAFGELPPPSLIIGALHVVCPKQLRLDRE